MERVNILQRRILVSGTALCVLAFVFPPTVLGDLNGQLIATGFGTIFSLGKARDINYHCLLCEWFLVILCTAVGIFLARGRDSLRSLLEPEMRNGLELKETKSSQPKSADSSERGMDCR